MRCGEINFVNIAYLSCSPAIIISAFWCLVIIVLWMFPCSSMDVLSSLCFCALVSFALLVLLCLVNIQQTGAPVLQYCECCVYKYIPSLHPCYKHFRHCSRFWVMFTDRTFHKKYIYTVYSSYKYKKKPLKVVSVMLS